ncbi:MAG TPA: hypothetical protein VEF76_05405 [Patescibacteria group bacterium]|nr:hypothetical protein [Patescibacteria group bacterium]
MPLSDVYNASVDAKNDLRHFAERVNDNVLFTQFSHHGNYVQRAYFDFLTGTVSLLVAGSNHDRTLTFAEMDLKVLQQHRDILIELGGKPQPLPATLLKSTLSPAAPKGLNP